MHAQAPDHVCASRVASAAVHHEQPIGTVRHERPSPKPRTFVHVLTLRLNLWTRGLIWGVSGMAVMVLRENTGVRRQGGPELFRSTIATCEARFSTPDRLTVRQSKSLWPLCCSRGASLPMAGAWVAWQAVAVGDLAGGTAAGSADASSMLRAPGGSWFES